MATFDTHWYVNSVGYAALTAWAAATAKTVGNIVRQTAPAVAAERAFVCIVAGNTHATTEPTWTNTRGAKTTDNTVTWQECTGMAAVNGDMTNTPLSSAMRSQAISLGVITKNNAATHLFICSTAGTAGAGEPSYNTTTGATTTDSGATWTCLGTTSAFSGGQVPHARLRNALAVGWYVNPNTVYIGHNSAETQAAAYSITAGNKNSPLKVISFNSAGSYPPTAPLAGATVTTTGGNALSLNSIGCYMYGVTFQCGSGAVNSGIDFGGQNGWQVYDNCSFQKLGTTANAAAIGGLSGSRTDIIFNNCTFKFGNVGDSLRPRDNNRMVVKNSTAGVLAAGSSVPTNFISIAPTAGVMGNLIISNCDLSQFGSGKTIIPDGSADSPICGYTLIENCKTDAAATLVAVQAAPNRIVDVFRCGPSADNYKSERYAYGGTQTVETTIIRTGGASNGENGYSHKIVTNSSTNVFWHYPFECPPIAKRLPTGDTTVTLTVEGIWGGGAVPNNDDIWMEVDFLDDDNSPLGATATCGKADALASGSALPSSSASWGGSTTAFKLQVTITPEQSGIAVARVKAARASSTFYIDPKVTLS